MHASRHPINVVATLILSSFSSIVHLFHMGYRTRPAHSLLCSPFVRPLKLLAPQRRTQQNNLHNSKMWMMPEGPEVKTLVDQLQPAVGMRLSNIHFISGRYVTHSLPKGYAEFRDTMTNWRTQVVKSDSLNSDIVQQWRVKGKFMYLLLDDGASFVSNDDFLRSIWITLGMSGRFVNEREETAYASNKNGQPPRWYLEFLNTQTQETRKVFYHDPRNFGTVRFSLSRQELQAKLDSLGPDILSNDKSYSLTEDKFLSIMKKQRPQMNVCKFLMDQKRISGIGNYLLAEGLYKAKVDPFASLCEISEQKRRDLFQHLHATAQQSYSAKGVTRPSGGTYVDLNGDRGEFAFQLQCYGRDVASNNQPVIRESNGPHGRTIWYTKDQLFMPLTQRLATAKSTEFSGRFTRRRAQPDDDDGMGSSFAAIEETVAFLPLESTAIETLSSSLTEKGWIDALSSYMASSPEFERLAEFLAEERENGVTVFPPAEDIFASLNLCPLDEVKVVIVGQDPYFGPGQGHGLAFSVRKGVPIPPSLRNIYKEVIADVGIRPPTHGCLESWAKQGVLLLNAVLSVRSGEANSHSGKGWEGFTDQIIKILNERSNGLVFLLWGAPAAKKAAKVDSEKHVVIKCSHPSPLSVTRTSAPFFGSRCFGRANAALEEMGEDPIDWSVP